MKFEGNPLKKNAKLKIWKQNKKRLLWVCVQERKENNEIIHGMSIVGGKDKWSLFIVNMKKVKREKECPF